MFTSVGECGFEGSAKSAVWEGFEVMVPHDGTNQREDYTEYA